MTRHILALFIGLSLVGAAYSLRLSATATAAGVGSAHVCGARAPQTVHCNADVVTAALGSPKVATSPAVGSYGPAQFHTAYNLPCTPGGQFQSVCSTPSAFGGQTIGIVDAYLDPNVESDLAVYDAQFGLPACTQANGCLKVLNLCVFQHNRNYKGCGIISGDWALEESLDVQVAHAMCQTCKILFVEANSAAFADLATAENSAVQNGATVLSNSWGSGEWSGETQYDSYWNHPGVAALFAAGDNGYGTLYPSVSPYALSVGGTTLTLNVNNTYFSETAWKGTGSGCSSFELATSWEMSNANWSLTGCGTARGSGDVAADADPSTGAAVYDSVPYYGTTGWYQVGGTSLATPLFASAIALAGGTKSYANPSQMPYLKMGPTNSHDVTAGSNGTCSTVMCQASVGYDGPTGLGSPNGTGGL